MKPSNPWLTAARYYPDLYQALADNDDHAELPAGAAITAAYGGRIGIAVMLFVAAAVGAMLAVGGV